MTLVLHVDPGHPDEEVVARAAACLRQGGLVAFPTETVYGLGVDALNRTAVRRLFAAKRRPSTDPLIVHVPSIADVAPLVSVMPDVARQLASRYWPGPLTLVLPRSPEVPDEVTAGLDTVAIRVPSHPVALAIISAAGVPVAAPSANLFSRPSPTRARHVLDDLEGRIDMIVDGGATRVGVESTVLDLSGSVAVVLRHGAITVEMLRAWMPGVRSHGESRDAHAAQPSPGMLSKHYAPRTPLTLFTGRPEQARAAMVERARALVAAGRRVGVVATTADSRALLGLPIAIAGIGSDADPAAIASRLYAALRELDAGDVDVLLACDPPEADGLSRAIRDRLHRAAADIVHEE